VTGHLGWHNDQFSVGINGIWGAERFGNDGHENGVANGLIKWTPNERFGIYLNGDYAWLQKSSDAAWGISLAGRFGITDRTGIALRGEYAQDVNRYFGFTGCGSDFGYSATGVANCGATGVETYGITATLDHLLTDQLMIRGEARYDWIRKDSGKDSEFFKNGRYDIASSQNLPNDQIVVGVELIYNFNKFGTK
jgi:hypothetical protein